MFTSSKNSCIDNKLRDVPCESLLSFGYMLFVMLLTSKGRPSQYVFSQKMVSRRECEFTHAFGPQDGEFIMTSDERISVLGFLLDACFSGLGLKSRVKRSKKGSSKSRIYTINTVRHLLAALCLAAERAIMRSAECLSIGPRWISAV